LLLILETDLAGSSPPRAGHDGAEAFLVLAAALRELVASLPRALLVGAMAIWHNGVILVLGEEKE